MKRHKVVHSDVRPFDCKVKDCKAAFKTAQSLKLHVQSVHLKLRPFECTFEDCQSKFFKKKQLEDHMRMHLKIKPYTCDCGESFTLVTTYKLHKMTHLAEKPQKCLVEGCGASFIRPIQLKKHNYYHHTEAGQVRMKRDESRILKFLEKHFKGSFKSQHHIDFICLGPDRDGDRCHIDFLLEIKDKNNKTIGFIFLEVDEDQHSWYDLKCENRRMTDAYRTVILEGNTFPIMFIRYNPDCYRIDGKKMKKPKKEREVILKKYIENVKFDRDFSIVYMFYDMQVGKPRIFEHEAYDETLKQCVTQCIV